MSEGVSGHGFAHGDVAVGDVSAAVGQGPRIDSAHGDEDRDVSESEVDLADEGFLEVSSLPQERRPFLTEQDAVEKTCRLLAQSLRTRPTLPATPTDLQTSWQDIGSGVHLPTWHCAFKGCGWHGSSSNGLEKHLRDHRVDFDRCRNDAPCAGIYTDMDLSLIHI